MTAKIRYHHLVATVLFTVFIGQAVFPVGAFAQDSRQLERPAAANSPNGKRTALVIGNGRYAKVSPLDNPVNDATDMAAVLSGLGFEVIKGTDTNLVQMRRLIREFGEKLEQQKGVGLFYYAGHGVEVRGKNFLVPVDADIAREVETEDYAIDLNSLMRQMDAANNGFNVVILDACRNNPFSRGWNRSGDSGGLANISAPTGTFIAFAAAPGSTASDGKGTRNGVFTGSLVKQLKRPNLKLEEVFKATREEVMSVTGNKQVPWDSSSVKGDFYFNLTAARSSVKTNASVPKVESAQEKEAWDLVKASADVEDLRFFLREFPNGTNTVAAQSRLEEMMWTSAKASNDKAKVQTYLDEFPDGPNAAIARIRLRQLGAAAMTPAANASNSSVTPGTIRKNSMGMELAYIPAGEFMMGSSEAEVDEAFYECKKYNKDCKRDLFTRETPKHKVAIKDGFWMGKYEVTQGQWQSVMGDNPSKFADCGSTCPVEQVSWDDIQVFLKRINAKNDGFEYSLPSEAQWEYAARAGTTTAFAFGDSLNSSQANFNGEYPYASTKGTNVGKTVSVGRYQPNAWGLYDMHGNVWEWSQDIYNASYSGLPTDGSANMSVGDANKRVLRGGSWGSGGFNTRSANRGGLDSTSRDVYFGFRILARPR